MTMNKTKKNAMQQKTPNIQKAPKLPIASSSVENHFVTAKPRIQQTHVTIVLAIDLIFGANISPENSFKVQKNEIGGE